MSRHSIPIKEMQVGFGSVNGTPVLTPLISKQIKVYSMSLVNRSGSTSDLAILKGISTDAYKVFTYDGTSVATEVTSTIQAGSNINICSTTSGSGLVVQSIKRFGFISFNVNTAGTGSPTISVSYWNGSAFVACSSINVATSFASGNCVIYVNQNYLMSVGANSFNASLDPNMYALRISVSSSTNSPTANSISVARTCEFAPNVVKDTAFNSSYSQDYPLTLNANESVIPYFSNVSDANMVSMFYAQDN